MQLERPALEKSERHLRDNIIKARDEFISNIINSHDLNETYLSSQLELYEKAAQDAVEGNLDLINAKDTELEPFPSKGEKWTIPQAIFFASTVCTTIGDLSL